MSEKTTEEQLTQALLALANLVYAYDRRSPQADHPTLRENNCRDHARRVLAENGRPRNYFDTLTDEDLDG